MYLGQQADRRISLSWKHAGTTPTSHTSTAGAGAASRAEYCLGAMGKPPLSPFPSPCVTVHGKHAGTTPTSHTSAAGAGAASRAGYCLGAMGKPPSSPFPSPCVTAHGKHAGTTPTSHTSAAGAGAASRAEYCLGVMGIPSSSSFPSPCVTVLASLFVANLAAVGGAAFVDGSDPACHNTSSTNQVLAFSTSLPLRLPFLRRVSRCLLRCLSCHNATASQQVLELSDGWMTCESRTLIVLANSAAVGGDVFVDGVDPTCHNATACQQLLANRAAVEGGAAAVWSPFLRSGIG
ncbi:unnamed protein product [Closterium sp. NIES-53]